jgi:tetratricopeptide (TPR) repeat protein
MSEDVANQPESESGWDLQSSRMTDELQEELKRINLQGHLCTLYMKDKASSILGLGMRVIILPTSHLYQGLKKENLSLEILASGLQESIKHLRPHGYTALLAESLLGLARTLQSYSGLENRLQLTLEAVAILQKLDARHRLSRAYIYLGSILKESNMLYDALRAFELAGNVSGESGDKGVLSASYYHKAVICRQLGLNIEALALLKRAEHAAPEMDGLSDAWLQQIASERILNDLTVGRNEEALNKIQDLIKSIGDKPMGDMHWMPYFHRAGIKEHSGDIEGALEDYCTAAIKASEQIRASESDRFRRSDRTRLNFLFETGLRVALTMHRPELAFGLLELSKTGGLARDPVKDHEDSEIGGALERLGKELRRLVNDAREAITDKGQREAILQCQERADWLMAQNELLSFSSSATPISREYLETLAAKVRAKLPEGVLLLEFVSVAAATRGHRLAGEEIWGFFLTRDTVNIRKTDLTLDTLVLLSMGFSQECQGIFPTDALDVLSRELLDPVGDILRNSKSLLVVPSVGLYGLPFHAMRFGGKRLVESHTVSYLTRASALLESPDRLKMTPISNKSHWKGLGTPSIDYADLDELLAVNDELNNIAKKFDSAVCVLDLPATSQDLLELKEPCSVLHVACHGEFDTDAPLLTRLMLSDRPVFAFEIMLAKLEVDLVVLSACQTGEVRAGLGGHVQSLAAAFLAAGAKSVIASLWPVDDEAGAECIKRFYAAMIEKRYHSIADSLRAAQHSMQREREDLHLYFWAPFALFSANGGSLQ